MDNPCSIARQPDNRPISNFQYHATTSASYFSLESKTRFIVYILPAVHLDFRCIKIVLRDRAISTGDIYSIFVERASIPMIKLVFVGGAE